MSACKVIRGTRRAFQKQMLERARALPQIENAALTDYLPLGLNYNDSTIYIEGRSLKARVRCRSQSQSRVARLFRCDGYSLRGRDFREDENKKGKAASRS